jgi:hypothetical protein
MLPSKIIGLSALEPVIKEQNTNLLVLSQRDFSGENSMFDIPWYIMLLIDVAVLYVVFAIGWALTLWYLEENG